MKRFIIALGISVILMLGGVVESLGQDDVAVDRAKLGVGAKIPPLILPNVFLAYRISDSQLIEVMASVQNVQFASSVSIGATLKQYLDLLEDQSLPIDPFIGGGLSLTFASVNVLGQATSSTAIAVNAIAGIEYGIPDTPFSTFLEFVPGIVITPIFGFYIGGTIGVRFDF